MRRANTLLFLTALLVAASGQTTQAANIIWDGDTSSDWTDGANWVGGVAPADDTTTDVAFFDSATTFQPSLAGARSVGGITFNNATGGWTLSGTGTLTVGTGQVIYSIPTSGNTNTISLAGLGLGNSGDAEFALATGSTLNVSSVISGPGGLYQISNAGFGGVLELTGLNTYTGPTTVRRGTLTFSSIANVGGGASNLGAPTTAADGQILMGQTSTGGASGLRYTGSGGSTDREIALGGSTNSVGYVITQDGGSSALTFAGNFVAATTGTTPSKVLTLNGANTADNTVSGTIPNPKSTCILSVTKSGTGKWILSGNNTYTGPTTVSGGTLVLNGTNAYTAATTVNGAGAALVLGENGAIGSGNVLTVTNGTVDIASFNQTAAAVTLTAGNITGTSGVLTGTSFSVNNAAASLISANLAGAAAMSKTLAGVLTLSGANTYTGKTSVNGGEVQYNSIANVGGGTSALGAPTTAGNGTIDLGSGAGTTLTYTGPTTSTDRVLNLAGTGSVFLSASGSGPITFTSDPTATGSSPTHRFALRGTNTGNNTISGVISDGTGPVRMDKINPGKWVLTGANTFSGSTATAPSVAVGEGTLEFNSIANVGAGASALGAPTTVFAGTILLGSFTVNGAGTTAANLIYTGSGHSTDRVIDLSGSTGPVAIYANGSGPLTFTSAFTASQTTTPGAKTLTLRGTNTGANTVGGAIVDGAGTTSLTKDDAGKWILGGANTYTGATTVTAGRLAVSGVSARLGTGNVTVLGTTVDSALEIQSGVNNAIADTATLSLLGGGTDTVADQGYADLGSGINETVASLLLNGVAQAAGTYGSTLSAATFQNNEFFAGTGLITVPALGDHNGDFKVNAADFVTWRRDPNSHPPGGSPDGYVTWRQNFNPAASAGPNLGGPAVVPEPSTIALVAAATAIYSVGLRRKRDCKMN